MTDGEWDPVANWFVDQYDTLYGLVRTHVVHQHLAAHLAPPPGRVVDVGGGSGQQSIPLAREGYDVTVVDPSVVMLGRAADRLAEEPAEVAGRVHLVEGAGEDAPDLVGAGRWDAVLCHGVLMYLDEPEPFLAALVELARPGAIVSIVAKNARALAVRPALDHDWVATLAAFDAERQVNGLGIDTRADTVEALGASLDGLGVEPLAWYGVRLFTEGWAKHGPPTDPVDDVLAAELEATRRDPYRQLSRLFHLIGRRR